MGLADSLVIPIRILTIVLLCIFIYTGYQGAMMVKELRTTVSERLEAGQFPLPTGGLAIGESEGALEASAALASVKDVEVRDKLEAAFAAQSSGNTAEMRRQLTQLDVLLAQKGLTQAQQINQALMSAIDRGDAKAASGYLTQLIAQLD